MKNFIKSFEYDGFILFHIGYETNVHMKYISSDFRVDVMVSIEDIVSSMNQNKKGAFRINNISIEGEKAKPSFMEFVIRENDITVKSTGPNDKNKSQSITISIPKEEFISSIKTSVKTYRDLIEFEAVGNKDVDSNKLRKKIEKLDKFLSKDF